MLWVPLIFCGCELKRGAKTQQRYARVAMMSRGDDEDLKVQKAPQGHADNAV